MIRYLPKPKHLRLQWHVTEKCNRNCTHCYQEGKPSKELDTHELLNIFEEYISFLKKLGIKGHVNITGGEPFLRKDIFSILEKLHEHKEIITFDILTNGSLINEKAAEKLKTLGVRQVQLSIEGKKQTNDKIRGKGSFESVIKASKILISQGVRVVFSFTSSKENYQELEDVVEIGKKLGVSIVWTDRIVLQGSAKKILLLEPYELEDYYKGLSKLSSKLEESNAKTKLGLRRALFFLATGKDPYACPAGASLIVIMPNGDVMPCRRLPIVVGNLKTQSLFEIFYSSKLLWQLRNLEMVSKTCKKCEHFSICKGGSRCVSYSYYKDPFVIDPQCWIRFKNLPDKKIVEEERPKEERFSLTEKMVVEDKAFKPVTPRLVKKGKNLFYLEGEKSYKLEELKDTKHKVGSKGFLVKVDLSKPLNSIKQLVLSKKPELALISFSSKNGINIDVSKELTNFLDSLSENKIRFIIMKPFPKCMFGFKTQTLSKKYGAPVSCNDCLELFIEDGEKLLLCTGNYGLGLKYVTNKNQIFEYFKNVKKEGNLKTSCISCNYLVRGQCSCFSEKN